MVIALRCHEIVELLVKLFVSLKVVGFAALLIIIHYNTSTKCSSLSKQISLEE